MAMKTAKTAAPLMVCVESFASSDVEHGSCARGTRLRADHPVVVKRPQYFAPADLSDDELFALRLELNGGPGFTR